ncbi:hypothetical protein BHF71_07415 [Vulcanibacillus modesticaldus]|uniref:Uncharacterized protein n=1 Tax=Vulcanibacillus modesticaldus TaxID=337097 RepID=A0A1D2YW11_9BACI|nr:hypothetical protein [Vulcanibacillus modesticaldus]OEF99928.1 hypothetical protein BHF71_07415 [Vulcanibacillus modesticaldus]
MESWFNNFIEIATEEQKLNFKKSIEQEGFSAINQFIRSFYEKIKEMDQDEFEQVKNWLKKGEELFPNLVDFSPSFENTWRDLLQLYQIKVELFSQVPVDQRDGEWQILYDNPYSTEPIVCHSNKNFVEATYLMAKYQLGIKKAEIVKLQKVITVIIKNGK